MDLHRAVSPIVATIILMLISIAAGMVLWLWISGFLLQTSTSQQTVFERIKIDAVRVDASSKQIMVYVRNLNNADVTISSVYIYDVGNILIEALDIQPVTIPPNSVKPITATYTPELYVGKSGYSFIVKAVTSNGVEASYVFVWP